LAAELSGMTEALIVKADLRRVSGRVELDLVLVVQAVGEAELDVESRGVAGGPSPAGSVRVVVTQMPVLVVDVHLHVERIPDLLRVGGIGPTTRVEDDLGVIGLADRHVADAGDERGDLMRGGVIGETAPDQVLRSLRQLREDSGATQ
jgi:hypothetical protein